MEERERGGGPETHPCLDRRFAVYYDNIVIMAPVRRVRFTEYALLRLRERHISEEEVRRALARPAAEHWHRRDGRSEVRLRLPDGLLLVVYRGRKRDITVITVVWE
jgi:hypothetical protein